MSLHTTLSMNGMNLWCIAMSNPLEIEVPKWGNIFRDDSIHPDNLMLVNADDRPSRTLTRSERKTLNKRHVKISQILARIHYDEIKSEYDGLRELYKQLKTELHNEDDNNGKLRIKKKMKKIRERAGRLSSRIEPYKSIAAQRNYIIRRFHEHDMAIAFARREKADRKEMLREVQHFAQRIQDRYTQLMYRQEVYKDGKRRLRKVQFERVYVTPDEIQFKINVASVTILGSNRNNLPEGVRVRELVKPETLDELSAATERPVWSPHSPPMRGGTDKDFDNGAWVVINRIGLLHGVPEYIGFEHIIPKYPGKSKGLAIPFGIVRGRKINWAYIGNTSPHFMVNGLTGSGKTNAIVGCLATLVQTCSPDEIRFLITDLKRGGNFRAFKTVGHNLLDGEIVNSTKRLLEILRYVVDMLYQRLKTTGTIANDIGEYNSLVDENKQLARVLVVIDEYSETRNMSDEEDIKKGIDACVDTIARLGRAAGIHLMLGNQQPYQRNTPSEVKGNITYHLTGFQMTQGASMSTVGSGAATKIEKIPGRMLCNNGRDIFEVQIAHTTNDDIKNAVEIASHYPIPKPLDWNYGKETQVDSNEDEKPRFIIPIPEPPKEFTTAILTEFTIEQNDGLLSRDSPFEVGQWKTGTTCYKAGSIIA